MLNWGGRMKCAVLGGLGFFLLDLGSNQISVMVFILQYLLPRNAQWTLDQT